MIMEHGNNLTLAHLLHPVINLIELCECKDIEHLDGMV